MPSKSDHRPKRKIAPGTWVLGIIVVLLLISRAVLAYFDDAWQWEGRLAEEKRLARAAGMYVTEADFLAAYQAPADPAANELLRDLMALPVVRETSVQDLGRLRRLLKRGTLAEREEVLRTYAPVLPLAEGLARQNRLFRPEILTVVQPRSRHHLTLQVAGHVLLHRAMVNDGKGKVAEAEIDYARVARLARLIASEPHPDAVEEGVAAMIMLMDVLAGLGLSEPETRVAQLALSRLERLDPRIDDRPSREGAAYAFTETYLRQDREGIDELGSEMGATHAKGLAARSLYETRKRWPGLNDPARQLMTAVEFSLAFGKSEGLQPVTQFGMRMDTPDFLGQIQASRDSVAIHTAFEAQLRGVLFLLQNGRVARSAAEIPNFPLDPFTGKPVGYRVTERGFLVWSAGADGIDDGGITLKGSEAFPPRNNMLVIDVVFEFNGSLPGGNTG